MIIHAEPLVGSAFEPFGDIIEASRTRNDLVEINSGYVTRHHALAIIDCDDSAAISIFEARRRPLLVRMLERHPRSSQAFMPLDGGAWLVVVAVEPEPESCRAFLCKEWQGVSLRRGTWHHPLLILDRKQSFLVVDREETSTNLEEILFESECRISL